MSALLDVVLPVFLVIGAGAAAAWRGVLSPEAVDGLMRFAQGVAIPCLLFLGLARLDLSRGFDPRLMLSFYGGSSLSFLLGLLGARLVWGRPWEDAVAIGFAALFSNSLLLGLAITERAFGPGATAANLAIISIHSPFSYALGITAMELARAGRARGVGLKVLKGMLGNALVVAILLGLAVNLAGLPLPGVAADALDLLARAGLPAALFGLGGVLTRYRPDADLSLVLFVAGLSLLVHPALTWGLGRSLALPEAAFRSAVVTAAMAPGINAYLFAQLYGRATRVAAASVLVGTALSVVTAAGWLWLLGG